MSKFEIIMPKMGDSVLEATITKWLKKPGDTINEDDPIAEIATDKVDSEIPSPVEGILVEVMFNEGDNVPVGTVIALIETDLSETVTVVSKENKPKEQTKSIETKAVDSSPQQSKVESINVFESNTNSRRFYSPLVKTIARAENISIEELDKLHGSGKDGRVTKEDVMSYIGMRQNVKKDTPIVQEQQTTVNSSPQGSDTIIEMDRMRKLIADHMINSIKTSAHVTSFIEVKMGKVVQWREKMKKQFELQWGEKLTYTHILSLHDALPISHIIIEAAAKTLLEFPNVNASVDGYKIILRKNINIGMATALPNGNLIVPVIKNADQKNILGLAKDVNRLAANARSSKLQPDDIADGTFTFTNLGSFGSLTGTPIINQPQVAILGAGVIQKRPVVIVTTTGDPLGI